MKKNTSDDYASCRVPDHARLNLFSVAIVRIGATTSLVQFMVGATLGHSMTLGQAMLASVLGGLILEFISLGLGMAGAREGLSTSLLSCWCGFGRYGSVLIGLAIALSMLGWFGVQNAILAKGMIYALELDTQDPMIFILAAGASGLMLTALVAFGFRGLDWMAKAAVPLFVLVVAWICFDLVSGRDIAALLAAPPAGPPLSLGAAATMVAGSYMVFAIISPDMSRYCRNGRHVFWMMTLSILTGEFIVNGISIIVAKALSTSDVVAIMTQSAGWLGLFSAMLSTVKINDINLYSSALGFVNTLSGLTGRKWSYRSLTFLLGTVGTGISLMGILEQFSGILNVFGILFPPIAGVMLIDYYILRSHRAILDSSRSQGQLPDAASTPAIGWPAMCAWAAGSLTGVAAQWGIPSLNSLLAAGALYWLLRRRDSAG
ncbi:purine-cytosine permease family protein [Martelella alba]|uniref:Cytosine permease n=1 Tax=Martelella alba TaxID=2590451 RepID=A0ABY2SSM1_9HYPH|nr:cytosine permease [Martelella alba]TKI07217.1 cytosine permease [Martelella alba]